MCWKHSKKAGLPPATSWTTTLIRGQTWRPFEHFVCHRILAKRLLGARAFKKQPGGALSVLVPPRPSPPPLHLLERVPDRGDAPAARSAATGPTCSAGRRGSVRLATVACLAPLSRLLPTAKVASEHSPTQLACAPQRGPARCRRADARIHLSEQVGGSPPSLAADRWVSGPPFTGRSNLCAQVVVGRCQRRSQVPCLR